MTTFHKTAITRNKPSAPMQWLEDYTNFDPEDSLDYGCGKGFDADHYGMAKWDPISYDWDTTGCEYKYIFCNYVLNVIPTQEARDAVLENINSLLGPNGTAYISVRNDKKNLNGWTKKGTFQTFVDLNLPIVKKTSSYIIYEMEKY